MEQPKNYNECFASVYDELMSGTKYNRWKQIIQQAIETYKIPSNCALDVACGTGQISKILLDLGFQKVYGLDKSKEMLKVAKKNLADYGERFEPIERDMCSIDQVAKYDLVVSFYDSINYLLNPSQVNLFLSGLERSLKPNGFAIFDMNTKEHITLSQRNPKRVFPIKGGTATFKFGGKGNLWRLEIQIKRKNQTFNETHLERGYSTEEIESMIKSKNLSLLSILSENKIYWDEKEHLSRQYYFLRKNL